MTERVLSSALTPSTTSLVANIEELPREMLKKIFSWTDEYTRVSLAMTNREFRNILSPGPANDFCTKAATRGYFKLLQWARGQGCPWDTWTFAATAAGNVKISAWLQADINPWNTTRKSAFTFGYASTTTIDGIKVLEEMENDPRIAASEKSRRENYMLEWLEACPVDVERSTDTEATTRIEFLNWMLANGCPWDAKTMTAAIVSGNSKFFTWLIEQGCPCDEWTFAVAVRTRNARFVGCLIRAGCPASNGHMLPRQQLEISVF
jgi:hypothetical protein